MTQRVRITADSGLVRVVGETRDDVRVEGASSKSSAAEVLVQGSSDAFVVRVPTGTDVVVGSRSGNVTLEGELGAVSVTTASADVTVATVASIDARTVSGKLRVDRSHGPVRLHAKSARVHVGRADGEVRIATVSGRIDVGDARGAVALRTVSGRVDVGVSGTGEVGVETGSGKVGIRVPAHARPAVGLTSVSGKRRIECPTGTDFVVNARSISGSITVSGP